MAQYGAEFKNFQIIREIPRDASTRFIVIYGELDDDEVYVGVRAQRKEADGSWVDLPNRILATLEFVPDILEGIMDASVYSPTDNVAIEGELHEPTEDELTEGGFEPDQR